MKTPDEIKKGLKVCGYGCDDRCPYDPCEGMEAMCRDALAYIKQLEAQLPKWISVEDRLPENWKERVLVKISDSNLLIGNPVMDTDRYFNGGWVRYGDHVTHWMPLPEPPMEDVNEQ